MYDLLVIGSGWAGFNAAVRGRKFGLKVCLIEKHRIGGTCLNHGCIPTKALLQSAKVLSLNKKSAQFGVNCPPGHLDFSKVQERKAKIIHQLSLGMHSMLKGVELVTAEAKLVSNQEVAAGTLHIKAGHIIVACGAKPTELPFLKFDGKKIISSNEILDLEAVPESLLIIGGGVIGCEFASIFNAFGSRVTIVEKMPQLLPGEDKEAAKKLEAAFKKKGIKVLTGVDASSINSKEHALCLVSVGRTANTHGLGLEEVGVQLSSGKVIVDDYLHTTASYVYAAGDCTGRIMLAHFAGYEGAMAAHNVACLDDPQKLNAHAIPNCIFTDPEVASVGLSEERGRELGFNVELFRFDFLASGMARILEETEGFIKIISDAKTQEIIGACIIGPKATELIGILTLAVRNRMKLPQLRHVVFAHPTLSEAISEALN
jgi:dihydrolipoamide dehydrogenase